MDYDLFVRYMQTGYFHRVNHFLSAFRVHKKAKSNLLLETLGKEEIKQVQSTHRITLVPLLGWLFSWGVRLRSAYYVRKKYFYGGLPPGTGFNLNDIWAGKLEIAKGDK